MIRALVFDFDGLIIDTETPVIEAWAALHREAGLPYVAENASRIVGHVDLEFDPWSAFGTTVDRAELEQRHRDRARELVRKQEILPGIETCLKDAKRLGLRCAIASNSTHGWVDTHLQRLGLAPYFEVTKCRDDVARGKPDPEVYRAVLLDFQLSGNEAIAFEDSEAGSLAAKAAGLHCVAIPNPSTLIHRFDHVDLRLESLAGTSLSALMERFC